MNANVQQGITVEDERVRRMIRFFPREFRRGAKKFITAEGRRFIGDKRKPGRVRKRVSKLNSIKGMPWASQVASQFRYKYQQGVGLNLSFEAGLIKSTRPIHKALQNLAEGKSYSSEKYMIIPMYNLYKHYKKPLKKFHQWNDKKEMYFTFKNGKIFYFDKFNDTLLFVGQKTVKMPKIKALNVQNMWVRSYPAFLRRYDRFVERTLRRLERKL